MQLPKEKRPLGEDTNWIILQKEETADHVNWKRMGLFREAPKNLQTNATTVMLPILHGISPNVSSQISSEELLQPMDSLFPDILHMITPIMVLWKK